MVTGLDAGADDYLTKPFQVDETWPGCGRCTDVAAAPGWSRCAPVTWSSLPAAPLPLPEQ